MRIDPSAAARVLWTGLALALVLGLATGSAQAASCIGSGGQRCAYDRIATYGQPTAGELRQPMAVALGPDGRIYVVDAQPRVDIAFLKVYNRDGRFLTTLVPPDVSAPGSYAPIDVGVSSDGTVYALDGYSRVVHRFGPGGGYRALWLPSGKPDRLAVQSDGSFWLLYAGIATVAHRDADGNPIGMFTVPPGDLTGLGVSADGHVFVGRGEAHGFSEYTAEGAALGTVSSLPGSDVAFAGNGDLVSSWGSIISRASRGGGGYAELGWDRAADLSQVAGIAVAPPGLLAAGRPGEESYVVADSDNHRVQILATDGTRRALVGAPEGATLLEPQAAWGLPGGAMVVADTGHRRLVRIGASGGFEGRVDDGGYIYPQTGGLNPATGETVLLDGGFRVRRLAADGTSLGSWSMPGAPSSGDMSSFASAVTVGQDGTIWAAHSPTAFSAYLAAYGPDGSMLRIVTDRHLRRPGALATGPGGEVFVVEDGTGHDNYVDVFGPDGSFRRRFDSLACMQSAESIAVDGAGRIYMGCATRSPCSIERARRWPASGAPAPRSASSRAPS